MKQLVSGFYALHINELVRLPLVPFSKLEWICRTQSGTPAVTVPITVFPYTLELLFPLGVERARQTVPLTHSQGPRGGKRLWFVCPTCRRRVGVLYHQNGLPFRCRICCNLVYPSQYPPQKPGQWQRYSVRSPRSKQNHRSRGFFD